MTPEHQARIREDIYKKYVPASYGGFKLPVPDEKTWVEATGRSTSIRDYNLQHAAKVQKLSESYNTDRVDQAGKDLVVGATAGWDGIALFGAKVTNKAFAAMHGLDKYYSHPDDSGLLARSAATEKRITRALDNYEDAQRAKLQSDTFWLETHPRDTILGKLASMAGETIATLPLYEAVGGGLAMATTAAKGTSLSVELAKSPVGKFVAKRIINSTDAFLSTFVESGGDRKKADNAALWAGGLTTGGALLAKGAGKVFSRGAKPLEEAAESAADDAVEGKPVIKVASAPLIKKMTANTIAMGGIPFAQDVAQSALHEMTHEPWFMKEGKITDVTFGQSHDLTHGIRVHPTDEASGTFSTKDGQIFKYGNRRQQQLGYNELVKRAEAQRSAQDPVMAKLHEAEKATLDSIALSKYKVPMSMLSADQVHEVASTRLFQINEAAAEAPVHLPELHKEEVEHSIEEHRKANPMFNNFMAGLEKLGVKQEETVANVTENNIGAIAKETGISNVQGASKKVAKAKKETSASVNAYASTKSSNISYFRNPRNRAQVAEAVSDRSEEGLNKFVDTIKKSVGGGLRFEDPAHLMLFAFGNRKSLPKGMASSLLYRLRQLKGYENVSAKEVAQEAGWLHSHLYDMSASGHLGPEDIIYRSTNTEGPYSWSKWQKQLQRESDDAVLAPARAALKQHPTALKGFNATVKAIQKASYSAKNAEEYLTFKRALHESSSAIVKHVASKGEGVQLDF